MQDHKIDFVISWVDDKDQAWRQEKSQYDAAFSSDDAKERYRDWKSLRPGLLKFILLPGAIFLTGWT